ncbi:MAG TPA: hypothetical protein VEC11_05950 [Allosphingosinicella sp.]|nr:hypothetical protein [Allosphingosinicella sp.]
MTIALKAALALGLWLAPAAASAQPIGDAAPATVEPDTDEYLQHAASVARVVVLERQGDAGASLFSTTGGDPAMNGEYIYLSFGSDPREAAQIFRVGDVLEWRVVAETPGRVLLAVRENVMNADGEIGERRRRVAVTWTPGPGGAAPTAVTVATAP